MMFRSILIGSVFLANIASAGLLYVDPNGDDADPCTQSEPCATIQHAHDVAVSGDTILVAGGTYIERVDITTSNLTFSGTGGAVMEPPNPGASDEAFDLKSGVHTILIKGFELRGGYGEPIFIRSNVSGVEIRDIDSHGNKVGMRISGGNDIVIKQSLFHDNENGIVMDNSTDNVRITAIESYDNDDGLGCDGDADGIAADETVTNLQVNDSLFYNNGEDGIDSKGYRTRVRRVIAYGNCRGIRFWNDDSYAYSSLIYGNERVGITLTMFHGPVNGKIELYNNTIHNPVRAILASGDKLWRLLMINNIGMTAGPEGKVTEVTACMDVTDRHNIWYRDNENGDHFNIVPATCGSGTVRYSGVEIEDGTYESQTGDGEETRAVDPEFVNVANDDFHLASTSPALDTGVVFPLLPATDLDGESRPQGDDPDRGAYED